MTEILDYVWNLGKGIPSESCVYNRVEIDGLVFHWVNYSNHLRIVEWNQAYTAWKHHNNHCPMHIISQPQTFNFIVWCTLVKRYAFIIGYANTLSNILLILAILISIIIKTFEKKQITNRRMFGGRSISL